jgi:hypothetical protein
LFGGGVFQGDVDEPGTFIVEDVGANFSSQIGITITIYEIVLKSIDVDGVPEFGSIPQEGRGYPELVGDLSRQRRRPCTLPMRRGGKMNRKRFCK